MDPHVTFGLQSNAIIGDPLLIISQIRQRKDLATKLLARSIMVSISFYYDFLKLIYFMCAKRIINKPIYLQMKQHFFLVKREWSFSSSSGGCVKDIVNPL